MGCSISNQHPSPTHDLLGCRGVPGCYLRHGVGRGVHELAEVNHALTLILGDVDGLDGGEAGVGIPEILQLQPPLHQAQVGPFHKDLGRSEIVMDHPTAPTGTRTTHRAREGKEQEPRAEQQPVSHLLRACELRNCRMMLG